ncbi:acyltransferase [Arthrobacter bambusae]|uniref:acyltransferase n=1 Tax=Arthrobacter bambusae TaxID=1338426 RepID=UPI00277FB532|nr:DapH/DapD/GlmU-related protein [Arthrobacter bambusae]MDQ0031445.1 acetyltransferase-like isoleucine patch superfamily enzyme [Arthrobacter bambusae]MDQ0099667.1 acetyltransferase-like isoleucine patch superfamily enzyme [Arthrobacter bambusae]
MVGDNFHVGVGTIIWAPQRLSIGNDVYVGKNATIQVDGMIGDGVLVANAVGIIGRTDHETRTVGVPIRRAEWVGDNPKALSKQTLVGSDVWIGYGAVILSGVTIGDSAIIAAGSVVTRDVAPNTVVAGSPATFRKYRFSEPDFMTHWAELNRRGIHRLLEEG